MHNIETEHQDFEPEENVIPLAERASAKKVLESPQEQEGIEGALNKIKESQFWGKVESYWAGISEKDKEMLYKEGEPNILKTIATAGPAGMGLKMLKDQFVYENRMLKSGGDKIAGASRTLMQLGMLTHPAQLTPEQLKADIASDDKSAKKILRMIKLVIVAFAPEALPEYKIIEPFLKGATETKTRLALNNQRNQVDLDRAA
jgi:hypothetical protein